MKIDVSIFYEECTELLDLIRSNLENVNFNHSTNNINEIFRAIHTIKGSASIFGFESIVQLAHLGEDLLDEIRVEKIQFDKELQELLLNLTDILETLSERMVHKLSIDSYTNSIMESLENDLKEQLLPSNPKRIEKKVALKVVEAEVVVPKNVTKKTILIVDDSSMIRSVASKAAESVGLNVVTANDGHEGLAKAKQYKFDLIFSDINMPQMGGLEMVEKIREVDGCQFIPIVMLTTETKDDLKTKGKALGVKAWMVKPFNKEKFALVLEKILS
jgi:two-component system chemotaxis response regulator CheY